MSKRLRGEVAWTGKFAAAMPLKGVEITWAHAPEEIRVLTSPDGSNFEEAICFRPTGKVFPRWMGFVNARFPAVQMLHLAFLDQMVALLQQMVILFRQTKASRRRSSSAVRERLVLSGFTPCEMTRQ